MLSLNTIDWNKQKRNLPADAYCSISVDGTDFKTQELYPFNRQWMSHKYKGAALKYEVAAISIFSEDIVWIYRPHHGSKHDLTIFRENLKYLLEDGEMVEADSGYVGEADFIRTRYDYATKEERKEKDRICNRHEACNRRFKCWGILKQEYRHDILHHGHVMLAIVSMTQLVIDNGSCLFGCEPKMNQQRDGAYSIDDFNLSA